MKGQTPDFHQYLRQSSLDRKYKKLSTTCSTSMRRATASTSVKKQVSSSQFSS